MKKNSVKKQAETLKKSSRDATNVGDIIVDCGKEYKQLNIKLKDIHNLIDAALHLRMLVMLLAPQTKKGTVGEKLLDDVDKLGPTLCDMAKRVGYKIRLNNIINGTKGKVKAKVKPSVKKSSKVK